MILLGQGRSKEVGIMPQHAAKTIFRPIFLLGLLLSASFSVVGAHAPDQPGQKFLLKPSDLPKPYATPPVAVRNAVVPRGKAVPKAPPGFKVTLFAEGLTSARFLATAPNGDIFLSERLGKK